MAKVKRLVQFPKWTPADCTLREGAFVRASSPLNPQTLESVLREDGSAQMMYDRGGAQDFGFNGRWEQIDAGSLRVTVTNQVNSADIVARYVKRRVRPP